MSEAELVIGPDGSVRMVYDEHVDASAFGEFAIQRASDVEPDGAGGWTADLSRVGGPVLGPFPKRSQALIAEKQWLSRHWLSPG